MSIIQTLQCDICNLGRQVAQGDTVGNVLRTSGWHGDRSNQSKHFCPDCSPDIKALVGHRLTPLKTGETFICLEINPLGHSKTVARTDNPLAALNHLSGRALTWAVEVEQRGDNDIYVHNQTKNESAQFATDHVHCHEEN